VDAGRMACAQDPRSNLSSGTIHRHDEYSS
jgi:hypothetical protein